MQRNKWGKWIAVVFMAAAVGSMTGCAGNGQKKLEETVGQEITESGQNTDTVQNTKQLKQNERDSVIVVMTKESEPKAGFNPVYGWGAGEHVHEPLIQSTLTVTTPDLKIGMDLAKEYSVSEDGLIWTVKIRDDAVFSDGVPLTAEDVAFTYNEVKKNSSVHDFTMFERAEALDRETVVFYLLKPYSIWPYTMAATGILPKHAYGAEYGKNPIGSGRYILKQWNPGQQVIFEANPVYYGRKPKMKQVTVLFMDEDAAFAAVKSGQADLAYTAVSYTDQNVREYELLACKTVDNRGFNLPAVPAFVREDGLTVGNDFTCEIEVRRAIEMGIDREQMIERVLDGYGLPAYSVCDQMPWYQEESKTECDKEKANQILEDAGWKKNAEGIREKNGIRARLEFLYPADDSVRQALAADMVSQLKELGIDTSMKGVGWDEAYDLALSQPLIWGWGSHTPMELYNIYHTVPETGLAEYSPYGNETVDQYMDEALASPDLETSYELWKQAQWDGKTGVTKKGDLPWIWLANLDHLYWVRKGLSVAGQKIHPHGHGWSIVNHVDQWTWQEK